MRLSVNSRCIKISCALTTVNAARDLALASVPLESSASTDEATEGGRVIFGAFVLKNVISGVDFLAVLGLNSLVFSIFNGRAHDVVDQVRVAIVALCMHRVLELILSEKLRRRKITCWPL